MDRIVVNFLKNIIFKPFGNYLSNFYQSDDFPIIGRFKRPIGANNCGSFYVGPNNYAISEGMPSGHSILSGFVAVFMYNFIIEHYNIKSEYKPIILFLTVFFILYTMYSRVLMNCHTIQQTIVGLLLVLFLDIIFIYILIIKLK